MEPRKLITVQDLKTIVDKFDSIDLEVGRLKAKTFEDVVKQVLRKQLGREPILEDGKDCTLFTRENDPNFYLAYKDKPLGTISYKQDFGIEGAKFTVNFEPF